MKTFLILLSTVIFFVPIFSGCANNVGTVTEKGTELFNVLENGVVANSLESAKENTKALNKLISSCSKNSEIYFPEGKYYLESVSSCIKINNKRDLHIYGDNAVIINTSFDPTVEINSLNYSDSMTVELNNCENILIEGLIFDYYRYTQVCGKIVEANSIYTSIELDPRFLDGTDKPAITGKEIASAIAVLDEKGAAIEDYYADGSFPCYLDGNKFVIYKTFGKVGQDAVVRFCLSTAPEFYSQETKNLTFNNVKSYSSPAAAFLMSGEGNSDFSFNNVTVAPPENAPWRWGANADGIFLNSMGGKANITNCTFIGMGDDALNVHSTAAKVKSVDNNKITLNYCYNDTPINKTWVNEGDSLIFYKSDFSICAKAKVTKRSSNTVTLEITEGTVSVGDFVENASLSPEVNVENVTVNGGRARAFLIQTDNVKIKNCNLSNLGLAAIIISPDINKWYEMGPSQNVEISGCTFTHLCAMGGSNCKGVIFSASSHDGDNTFEKIHKNIVITDNTFVDINVPVVNLTSVDGATVKNNHYPDLRVAPTSFNCKNAVIE